MTPRAAVFGDDMAAGSVLGTRVHATSQDAATAHVIRWAQARESRYVCVCNVHMAVTANHRPDLARAVNESDLTIPDGAPVAWTLRRLGFRDQSRVAGPDFMWGLCEQAARAGLPVFLFGSTQQTLDKLKARLRTAFPGVKIAGAYSPPFRDLTPEEGDEVVRMINVSDAALVFVGLGCPKQELWMAAHRGKVRAVMLGFGAAFDFHAGTLKRAPLWMQRAGLEWLHRLISEPRRLWKRYLVTNTLFIAGIASELAKRKGRASDAGDGA